MGAAFFVAAFGVGAALALGDAAVGFLVADAAEPARVAAFLVAAVFVPVALDAAFFAAVGSLPAALVEPDAARAAVLFAAGLAFGAAGVSVAAVSCDAAGLGVSAM